MDKRKLLLTRWKTDYDFKTILSAAGSLAVTAAFALYNGFLGVYHSSLWYGTICIYYLILAALRGTIILLEKRLSGREDRERKRNSVCLAASLALLVLNVSLIVPLSLMVRLQKPVTLTLVPAIAMAAYTTYKITMASVNLRKRKRSSDCLVRLLRTINFIDALVSVLTLQNTLIMVSNGDHSRMLPLTALTSAAVFIAVLCLTVAEIVRCLRSKR